MLVVNCILQHFEAAATVAVDWSGTAALWLLVIWWIYCCVQTILKIVYYYIITSQVEKNYLTKAISLRSLRICLLRCRIRPLLWLLNHSLIVLLHCLLLHFIILCEVCCKINSNTAILGKNRWSSLVAIFQSVQFYVPSKILLNPVILVQNIVVLQFGRSTWEHVC